MRNVLDIDNKTLVYLTFILGITAVLTTRKNYSALDLIPDDTSILAKLIAKNNSKSDPIDDLIKIFGYTYDPKQDIFYTTMYAWQRKLGYCTLFDEAAAVFSMIIDCEPIYFEYDNKRWFIGLWKGQYGMTTGGEIGIYSTNMPNINIPGVINGAFYRSVADTDRLQMSYTLNKNGVPLLTREDRHWWLAGFKLGEFSEPSELTMDINITLKDEIMRSAFVSGLKSAGYLDSEILVNENTVSLEFDKPRSPQPITRTIKTDWAIQRKNELLCILYRDITKPYFNSLDKIKAVQKQAPEIYRLVRSLVG